MLGRSREQRIEGTREQGTRAKRWGELLRVEQEKAAQGTTLERTSER
jgi:hypothetical protein